MLSKMLRTCSRNAFFLPEVLFPVCFGFGRQVFAFVIPLHAVRRPVVGGVEVVGWFAVFVEDDAVDLPAIGFFVSKYCEWDDTVYQNGEENCATWRNPLDYVGYAVSGTAYRVPG